MLMMLKRISNIQSTPIDKDIAIQLIKYENNKNK